MIIGPKKLLKLVKEIKLVEDLAERELTNPEGAGFDLRLGEVHKIFGSAFLGIEERQTPKIKTVAKHTKGKKQKITNQLPRQPEFVLGRNVFLLPITKWLRSN